MHFPVKFSPRDSVASSSKNFFADPLTFSAVNRKKHPSCITFCKIVYNLTQQQKIFYLSLSLEVEKLLIVNMFSSTMINKCKVNTFQ